ncbi:LPD38 domain-containing protein [Phocaeicola plebeius]|uniref:LPD38 domain-containing protein n=1 Tax=Phocaeicola plebeius TaxID=310297 RepID=UPI003F7D468D
MSADTRKKIYDILKNKTGFMDSYEDFDNDMTTSEDARKKVYEVLRDKTGFNDTYENFVSGISGEVQKESAISPVKEESGNVVTTVQSPSYLQRAETKERILNNIPDYFQSKGTNLSTLPLPQNTMSAEKPADIPGRIVQDEQQRIQLAERSANDPYMKQQELEHVFKPKNQEQIDSVRQLINSARQRRVKERQQRVKSAGGGGIFSTMSQAYLSGEQNDADKQLEYASTLIEQAQNITNEAKKKGNTNFFSGFARGFKDAPLDGWAMGLQDLKNYSAAKKVMDKVDRGEELSPSEDALMQALVTNAATQMYYSGDLGRGYKAGGVTAESLPFMLDMIAGMGTIQSVTKPASKALVKYATEKAAKMGLGRATTGLAKGAARTASGLGDVAAHTATFGGARVAADYQRRGLGDVQVSPEQDGTVSYAGRDNVQTGAEAIGKSVVSTAAETGSELLGEYFAPMLGWVGKVTGANRLEKIIPASVGKAYSSIINSNGFKQVQEIARRAKIADPIGEYGEEVVNNLVSTAIGDMTTEQLVDLDNNIDTFLGVAPMSALFGAVGTGGYLREKYRNYRNMREFENQMRDTMGEDWSGVREALQDADIETARGMVKEVLSSNMQPDIKKKAINYISSVLQEQTLQEADKQIAPEEMIQNKRFIISNLNEARNNIGIGEEELNSAVSILNQEGESALSELYDAETVQKIVEYKNAYDDYLNYTYWVQNQAYDARKEAESQVERMTNATTGTVMRVKSGLSQNPVNILRGNIVFDAEGNVDKDSSDNTIYYLSEDGKVKMAPISMFESLVDDTPADELAYQAGEDAEQEFIQAEEAQLMQPEQSVQPIELETTFQKDGVTYVVSQKSPDGYVVDALDEEGNPVQSDLLTEEQIRTAMTPAIQEEQTSQEQFVQNEDVTQPEQQQVQTEPQTAISRIPVNENGEHDFESAPYHDTSSALIEISESVDDAKDTAAQMINHYQEELKKADKAKTTGNTIQEIVRLKQQKKANIQSINDKIAYWNSVANDIESKRPGGIIEQAKEESDANQQRLSEMTAEQQKDAQEEVQKKIDSGAYERKEPRKRARYVNEDNEIGTANTPMEHVLREIATGRVTFNWNDSGETQGLGSHLGLASSPEERRRMIWALSSDGMTPEAAAEQIHADMPENLQGMVTDQDVFNMILDAFHQNGTPSKMWESAKSMHGTDVEESAPGYEDYMEQQALEWEASQNNMTVEEWISYVDYVEEELDNMYSSVSDEDLNAIFENFNEQIISENESRGNETESAGSTEGQTDGEQGDELLPEGRGNNEGADTTVNEQQEQANQADSESSGVVPESEGAVKTEIEAARKEVDQNPTEAQKEAGNYKKGHVKVDGFDITIESPKGSVRSGKDSDGKEWSVTMNNDYGYIRGTEGVDGDHIDVFLSDNPEQGNVYVIDQVNQKTGEYDESKVMYGFNSLEEAKDAYLSNFEEGWKVGVVSGVTKEEFRKWIESSVRKTKPFSEYKSVKVEEAQNEEIRPDEGVLDYAKRVAEREERVRQRIEEERKAQEAKDATPLGKFLKTLNRLQAGKADGILSDNVSFNGETMSKADFIQRVIADGYAAEEYLDGTKIKYRLVKNGKGYKINKTEFDFAKFAGAGTIEVENKDDLINLERLSRKYADKGVYTMADIDKRIASTERRLKGTNENGKEGKELKKALEELNELKRLKEMQNSTRTKQEENVESQNTSDEQTNESGLTDSDVEQERTSPKERIEDTGEKIGGARKDIIRKYADKINLAARTFSKMFPKPDIKALVEAGVPIKDAAAVKAMYDIAKAEYKRRKSTANSVFFAMYAKQVLSGDRSKELVYNGVVFTEYGKEVITENEKAYAALYERLGLDYSDIDLYDFRIIPRSGFDTRIINFKELNRQNQELSERRGKNVKYLDGDKVNFVIGAYHRAENQFETIEDAIDAFVERVKKETKLDAPKYSPSIYWKKKEGYTDYSTTWVGTKIKGFGLVDVKSFKSSSEARKWLAEHQEDFQQMSAAEESRLNEEKKEGVASYTQIIEKEGDAFVVKIKVRGIGQPIEVKRFPIEGERYSRERSLNYKKMMDESSQWAKSEECKQISDEIAQNALSAKETSGKVKIKTETDKMRERVGEDYRNGRDITTNELLDTFGFRAIEFGNYVNQKERQSFLNNIYDSLMDMSKILGISPKGLSLGGKLAIAYGARGKSAASGHYEPYKNVINVTKTSGNGVFAHEWMHALDYYFSSFNPENIYSSAPHATSGEYKSDIRDEVKSSFDNLMSVIKASDYYKRSVALNEYYSSDAELAARALQDYIIRKLEEKGQVNDFLSNHITPEEWSGSEKTYPFPSGKEVESIGEAFNNLFDTIEEKVDEEGNTILFREEGNPDTRFRFIGEQGAANLDRVEEATTRLDNLNVAREMEKSGKDAKSIKIATGWERGADNKWRYEEEDFEYIPKGNAREKSLLEREPWHKELMSLSDKVYNGEKLSNEEEVRFDELSKKETELKDSLKKSDIKFLDDYVSDNTLFKEYPELKQVKVEFYDGSFFDGGSYSHHDMTIRINNNSPLDAKSILVHEVQHAIQHIEGFSRGGNSRTYRNYLNSLKEKRDAWSMIDEFEEKSKELGSDASKMDVYKAVRDEYTSLGMSFGDGIMPSRDAFDKGFNLWARGYDKEGYEDAYKEYQNLIEKFGLGESKDRYHELSGEVEARNVQSRLNMTPEERRSTLASETEDVAREDQIFLYDSMGANSMTIDENQDLNNIKSEDVEETAKKLNVPVEVITSVDQIKDNSVRSAIEKGRKVKGWYSLSDNKVCVYLPNATSMEDVNQTILHEGVAHYGLRQLVGEDRMDDFLDDIFANVTDEVRKKIIDTLPRYGYNSRIATEEYMARMAENGVDVSVWQRIKQAFNSLMRRMGINIKISDNELRYILWRSAQNLDKNRPIDLAIDVAMQYNMGVGNYFREGESDGSREEYENSLQGWKYKAREAYQDSMLALKNLQEVIANVSGKPIKSFEDAYKAENQLSSKNTAEAEEYYEKFFKPMLEAEGKMMKNYGLSHKEIERYMMLAHGIERNVEMTFREMLNEIINTNPNDAQQFADDFIMERDRLRNMYSGYEYLKALSDYIGEVGDFSATEAILTSIDNEEHTDFQNDALEYVKDFESKYDTSVLWDKTNRATKETLKKTYESGMMNKDHFSNVSKMFMYYVPLRGWNEKTAEDVYEYINSERSPLNSVLKSMKGRKSVPDEVMATIGNMAESAILQGNKNLMKQSFMNMVMNHPTDVATMRKAWYVYDQAKDEWTISIPEIQDNDTPEIISQKISDHEEKMKNLKEKGLATQKSSGLNIDYRILKNNISQHTVVVKNGGKDYIIYVNGNPRAAQAVNGLTNPDAEKNPIFNSISRANRWLAANFTTRNPAFVMSNLARDMIFSMSAIGIKEDAKYSAKFRKNLFVAIPTVFDCIRGKCKNSQSDMYFKEFVKNGGETGYMHLNDVDKYKKKVKKELSKITGERGSAKAALDYTLERLEDFNRWAEDVSRFAVYMTSRQMGRSIVDSVNDAKEVTVNFNKKGAGYKTGGFFGITAGIMRNLYLFFNASVQSLSNFNRLRVKNPVRFYSTLGGFIAAGVIMPVINDFLYNVLGGGDDNPYNDLPEWVRRNNLCIYAGNGQFVTIPLPIELRAFYGLGDYAYHLSTGREKPTPTGIAKGTVSQIADLLPLNPTGNEGFKTFMPDALSPIFETYVWNEDFTGKPIAKLTPFNERDPEWKRVYKGTSGWLVDASKFFNDLTNGGGPGSDFRKGFIDFNPAKVENLLESYFGGMAKFLNQSGKTIYYGAKSMAEGEMDENLVARNVPIVNRFYNKIDDRNAFYGINTEYFNLRDEMEQFKYELNGVKKNYRNNPEEYRQIVNSDMFRKYMRYKPYQDRLDRLYKMAKELEGQERKQIEDMIIEIRRELVNSLK